MTRCPNVLSVITHSTMRHRNNARTSATCRVRKPLGRGLYLWRAGGNRGQMLRAEGLESRCGVQHDD